MRANSHFHFGQVVLVEVVALVEEVLMVEAVIKNFKIGGTL